MTVNLSARAAIGGSELRVTGDAHLELRDASDTDGLNLVGYASVTERGYTIQDWLGDYTEIVRTGAFTKTISDGADVRLLINHEGIPLARTKSGTMTLREVTDPASDPMGLGLTGLYVDAPNLDASSPLVQSLRSAMKRGDLDQMSFGFQVMRQQWSPDYDQRDILEVRLFDVSTVTYPANDTTITALRSGQVPAAVRRMIAKRSLDPEDVNMLTQAMAWFSAVDNIVDKAQADLASYLTVPNPDEQQDAARSTTPSGPRWWETLV